MAGDVDIPRKIAKLDVNELVKKCLVRLWTVEMGDPGIGYKAKYLTVISEHIDEVNL